MILKNLKYRLVEKNGIFRATYQWCGFYAEGNTPNDAIEALENTVSELGLSRDEIVWRKWRKNAALVLAVIGLLFVAHSMASVFPKYILNSLQTNRNAHLHMLNRMTPERRERFISRLCETALLFRLGLDEKTGKIKQIDICTNPSGIKK